VVQIPSALITALNGLVVVFVVSSETWRKKRQRRRLADTQDEESQEIASELQTETPLEKTS